MHPGDLRSWLSHLESEGDLVTVDGPVSTRYEIAAYIKKSCNESGPAFRFTDVEGHDMDVVGGLYGTKRRNLQAMGAGTHERAVEKYYDAKSDRVPPVTVGDGPVREVVDTDPDLSDLPIVLHSERDFGHYITAGVVVADLPHTGVRGQGIHRMLRVDGETLSIWAPEERRVGYAYRTNGERGERTEVAIAIGVPPAVTMGSIANVPHSVDKYDVAGAIAGEPIELVPCETVDVEVPATAELVIEGEIDPGRTVTEAPFGEVAGCYSGQNNDVPPIDVTGITMRSDAFYHTILTGFPPTENSIMQWIPRSATVRNDAERAVPEVDQAVVRCGSHGGNGVYEAFVSIDKQLEGEPWNVIASVLGGRSQSKYCTVVDSDIDVYEEAERNWALNTRVQPDDDVFTFPRMAGAPLDPSGGHRQSQKMGIDATVPLDDDREKYDRVRVPGVEDVTW